MLTEPKNALVKQYQRLFSMENADLQFTDEALQAIALRAKVKETGARGLRSIIEEVMLDIMFDLPEQGHGSRYMITKDVVEAHTFPKPKPEKKKRLFNPNPPQFFSGAGKIWGFGTKNRRGFQKGVGFFVLKEEGGKVKLGGGCSLRAGFVVGVPRQEPRANPRDIFSSFPFHPSPSPLFQASFNNSRASSQPAAGRPYSLAVTRARAVNCRQRKAGRVAANSSLTVR